MSEDANLWTEIKKDCLEQAWKMLKQKTPPTIETTRAVRNLAETAVSIDLLDLR